MAAIDYPCKLPGILVASNSYSHQDLVRRNDLSSGPPIFRLLSEDAWVIFDAAVKYSALEVQVFKNWHRYTLANGSKLFNIDLMVDGFDGTSQVKTHECYFNGVPSYTQNGKRWTVSFGLIAIEPVMLDECSGENLIVAFNGFENLTAGLAGLDAAILAIEELWIP